MAAERPKTVEIRFLHERNGQIKCLATKKRCPFYTDNYTQIEGTLIDQTSSNPRLRRQQKVIIAKCLAGKYCPHLTEIYDSWGTCTLPEEAI